MDQDPLFHGTSHIPDTPLLTNSVGIMAKLEADIRTQSDVGVMHGPPHILRFAQKLFPELLESNNIGKNKECDFEWWDKKENSVMIEMDPNGSTPTEGLDVYIGGPCALWAAAIQGQTGRTSAGRNVLYITDGLRYTSNWKGSASIIHARDSMPLYHWYDNIGPHVVMVTLRHALQRIFSFSSYMDEVREDPNWNKLRMSFGSTLRNPGLLKLMVMNQIYALRDVGPLAIFHRPFPLLGRKRTAAYVTTHHADLSHEIMYRMGLTQDIVLRSTDHHRSLGHHVGAANSNIHDSVFGYLESIAGDLVESRHLSAEELAARGYDIGEVTSCREFPRDAYILPDADLKLEKIVREGGGEVMRGWRISKIRAVPTLKHTDVLASSIVLENMSTGETKDMPVRSLYLSLGPSMRKLCLGHNGQQMGGNLLQNVMWAAGVSVVFLVKVDKDLVPERDLQRFRDHSDAHNSHVVRLGEREVVDKDKRYQCFLLQLTGGGTFPSRLAHPEVPYNLLASKFTRLLRLNQLGVESDVISIRSCGRGLTASNAYAITAPLGNTVMIYGLGGTGMTTMVSNGLLMQALMKQRGLLAEGSITAHQFHDNLRRSKFGEIPYWKHENVFDRNYAMFTDTTYRTVPKRLLRTVKSSARIFGRIARL